MLTLLFNLENLQWDKELIENFGLTGINLPEPKPSAFHFVESIFEGLFETPLPITAMIGDSHTTAFGEGCLNPETAKATFVGVYGSHKMSYLVKNNKNLFNKIIN
jgi:glycerol kinase